MRKIQLAQQISVEKCYSPKKRNVYRIKKSWLTWQQWSEELRSQRSLLPFSSSRRRWWPGVCVGLGHSPSLFIHSRRGKAFSLCEKRFRSVIRRKFGKIVSFSLSLTHARVEKMVEILNFSRVCVGSLLLLMFRHLLTPPDQSRVIKEAFIAFSTWEQQNARRSWCEAAERAARRRTKRKFASSSTESWSSSYMLRVNKLFRWKSVWDFAFFASSCSSCVTDFLSLLFFVYFMCTWKTRRKRSECGAN